MKSRGKSGLLAQLSFACAVTAVTGADCRAGLFRVESETLMAGRNDADHRFELPTYESVSANYLSLQRDLAVNFDMSVFGDAVRSRSKFNLHLLNVSYEMIPDVLNINVGRSFDVQRTIRSATIDTAGIDLFLFEKELKLGVFAGKERRLELRQWQPTATLYGAYARYLSSSLFPWLAKVKFQRRDYDRSIASRENLVQLSAQKPFVGAWSPEYLLDSELDAGSGHLNRLDTGFDLYPTYRTSLRTRLETYELKPIDGIEQPIFSIFSQGRLYEASLQAEYQFSSGLALSVSGAYDNYVVQAPTRTEGYKIESDARYRFRAASISNAIYFMHGFGGELYGDRIVLTQKLTDKTDVVEALDYAYYHKITSSRRAALSSQASLNHMIGERFRLTVGGELNSNNDLKYDARAFTKLTYLMWSET